MTLIKQAFYYLFYAPAIGLFYLLCLIHKEGGKEFWQEVKTVKFNLLVSCLWWLFLFVVILGVIMSVDY